MDAHDLLVRDLLTLIDLRDWPALTGLVTDDVVYHRPGYPPLEGVAQFLHFYAEVRIIAGGAHRLDALLTTAEQGFCWGHFRGHARSGAELDEIFADWYQFRDGRISRRRSFFYRPAI